MGGISGYATVSLGQAGYLAELQEQVIQAHGLQQTYQEELDQRSTQDFREDFKNSFRPEKFTDFVLGFSHHRNATYRLQVSAAILADNKSQEVRAACEQKNLQPWTLRISQGSDVEKPSILATFKHAFHALGLSSDKIRQKNARENLAGMLSVRRDAYQRREKLGRNPFRG